MLLLTWPALEALVSERETQAGVQEMVGIYNCTWAGAAAFAYFTGGKLYDAFGAGAVFWLPAGIFFAQFLLLLWLEKHHDAVLAATPEPPRKTASRAGNRRAEPAGQPAGVFDKWRGWPIRLPMLPSTRCSPSCRASRKNSRCRPRASGLFCSVWFSGGSLRLRCCGNGAAGITVSAGCWRAFLLLIVSLAAILLATQLWLVVLAQIFFGLATGLIYYSSLFYSMDVGEASSEHGGLHEAFIGMGIFLGPATGAAALHVCSPISQRLHLGGVGPAGARVVADWSGCGRHDRKPGELNSLNFSRASALTICGGNQF